MLRLLTHRLTRRCWRDEWCVHSDHLVDDLFDAGDKAVEREERLSARSTLGAHARRYLRVRPQIFNRRS